MFVSGYEFHKLANWSLCPRYEQRWSPAETQENDIVFLNLDYFDRGLHLFSQLPCKIILITHNSDQLFTDRHYALIEKYVNIMVFYLFSV